MKIKKRLFKYSEDCLKGALKSFADANKTNGIFKKEILKGVTKDAEGHEVPNVIEIASRIEDFAEIIKNNGFDAETQTQVSISDLSNMMEDFVQGEGELLTRDFSTNTLGFLVMQTVTRLVSKMEMPELEAWQFVSRDLVIEDGHTIYNVTVGVDGHATSRIAEGGEYKAISLESTEDYIKTAGIKVGVKVRYSDEAKQRMGLIGIKMLTEAALNDIKRFKSLEAIRLLEANAKTIYDGLDPEKMPSGRTASNIKVKNGTLTMTDLREFFAVSQTQGYDIDVMMIHPLATGIFMYDKAVSEYFKEKANIYYILPKKKQTISQNIVNRLKSTTSNTVKAAQGQEPVIAPVMNKPYTIIVTPFLAFHKKGDTIYKPATRYTKNPIVQHEAAANNCTDLLLIDSSRALTHVHNGKGIIADTIQDRFVDTEEIKFKTYYQFLLDRDHGVFAFRNLNITKDIVDIDTMDKTLTYAASDLKGE